MAMHTVSLSRTGLCEGTVGFLYMAQPVSPRPADPIPYTRQKARSKYINRIRLERASQKKSSDTHKTPYGRVKRRRESKIYTKASERVNQQDAVQEVRDAGYCREEEEGGNFSRGISSGVRLACPASLLKSACATLLASCLRRGGLGLQQLPGDRQKGVTTPRPGEGEGSAGSKAKTGEGGFATLRRAGTSPPPRTGEVNSSATAPRMLDDLICLWLFPAANFLRSAIKEVITEIGVAFHGRENYSSNLKEMGGRVHNGFQTMWLSTRRSKGWRCLNKQWAEQRMLAGDQEERLCMGGGREEVLEGLWKRRDVR
ncbi:hypothetical protein PR048_004064 [Dryococelus australis]|uniref:Uncharacterized protein n=1 Tax=Dryococelus australis TaxID=614101 RepID=A0ABQ9I4E0_9NEOP|nr:hypothetical protein PR048_004064 [Dryococelus australis]